MTNHLEIKHVLSWKFPEKSGFCSTFFYMPIRSSDQVLESSRRIEKLVELSRTDVLDLYLAYDIIVVT